MLQLKCTLKVLKFLGIEPAPLPAEESETLLGAWHVNLVEVGSCRFFVFLNDRSLYCLIDVLPAARHEVNLPVIFRKNLLSTLLRNGVNESQIKRIAEDYKDITFTKTDSRKTLGNLNDIVNQLYFMIEASIEKNKALDMREVEKQVNGMPQRNLDWKLSRQVFLEMAGAA